VRAGRHRAARRHRTFADGKIPACRLIRFKKNDAEILEERFNNGRHVWWVAAPDGAQMELIEKASDGAAPQLYPRQWRTGRRVINPGAPR
jgi:hypothetical protein